MKRINFKTTLMTGLFVLLGMVAKADNNPIVVGNSRFTFITENLVRMEYANHQKFLDDSTLFAVNRQAGNVDVKVEKKDGKYIFSTSMMSVEFENDGFPFGQNNVRVSFEMDGKRKSWCMTDEQRNNLGGAITTLDAIGSPIPLQEGLLSRDGWYLINDTGKDVYKNGWLSVRDRDHVQDLYLFVYGNDYKSALRSLKAISGAVPMTRKYAHGSWYCRWWQYTADDYRDLVKGYHEHDFPLDIMVFDMDWHRKDGKIGTGHAFTRGWTGYSWNRKLIPDPGALIREFHDQQIYVTINEHPHDGIRPHEDVYPEFIRALGIDADKDPVPIFDAGDRKYMDAFMRYAHQESDSMGVAFWWLDWQQDYAYPVVRGTTTKHLPWLNEIYYNYSKQGELRGTGFSRWGGWGDHRHPIQFSGDAVGNWNMLNFEVKLTTTSGNAGCFFWAHDIGGFYDGLDSELYTRWTQFGLLNSSLRIHSVVGDKMDRRPWLWGEREEKAMRRIYHMRSELMPYIYSSVRQCHTDMLPLNRGLYIEYPADKESYKHEEEFLFGDLILASPITQAGSGKDKIVSQSVWFPRGDDWYSLFTGSKYEGGKTSVVSCPLEEFPVFVKGGWPLPMQPYTERMASTPLTTLVIRCYPGSEGSDNTYSLYEDDGLTMQYANGNYATTDMTYKKENGCVTVHVHPVKGNYKGQPQKRAYRIELPGVDVKSKVKVNGKTVKPIVDSSVNGIIISVKATDIRKAVEITVR